MAIASHPDNCLSCSKTAFPTERITIDGDIFHKACLRCAHCNTQLSLGNFARYETTFLCKPHFKQLFKEKGRYETMETAGKPRSTSVSPISTDKVKKDGAGDRGNAASPRSLQDRLKQYEANTRASANSSPTVEKRETLKKGHSGTLSEAESNACTSCQKPVYLVDKLVWNDQLLHHACFRCKVCNQQLTFKSAASHEGELFCISHHRQSELSRGASPTDPQDTISAENNSLRAEVERLTLQVSQHGDSDKYQEQLSAKSAIAGLESEQKTLKKEISQLQHSIKIMTSEKESMSEKVRSAEENNQKAVSDASTAKEKVKALEETLTKLKDEVKTQTETLDGEIKTRKRLEADLDARDKEIASFKTQLEEAKTTRNGFEELQHKFDSLTEKEAVSSKAVEQSKELAAEESARVRKESDDLRAEINSLKEKLEQSTSDHEKTNANHQTEIHELGKVVAEKDVKISDLAGEMEDWKLALIQAEGQILKFENSKRGLVEDSAIGASEAGSEAVAA